MNLKKLGFIVTVCLFTAFLLYRTKQNNSHLQTIAIANYGPHSTLEESISGLKQELTKQGFIENKNIQYKIADVGFNSSLIPQMISNLKNTNPSIMVVLTTPVAQYAKGTIQNIPLIYSAITDPKEAGLIITNSSSSSNMTGSSDKQEMSEMLIFAKELMPKSNSVGLLYSSAESNDLALLKTLQQASKLQGYNLVAIPIDEPRDIPIRMQKFRQSKVDFIYVGTSGPIQPSLPTIAAEANKLRIPVINVSEESVKNGLTLASFGVNYTQVGINTAKLVAGVLNGTPIHKLKPIFPRFEDHKGFINKKRANEFGLTIPSQMSNVTIVE